MAKSMIINATDTTGAATTSAITNVNPNATNGELIALAQGLNGLTKNTYRGATLVEKTELVVKPERTLTFEINGTETTTEIHAIAKQAHAIIKINGAEAKCFEAMPQIIKNTTDIFARIVHYKGTNSEGDLVEGINLYFAYNETFAGDFHSDEGWNAYDANGNPTTADGSGEIVLLFPETTQYAAQTLTLTVTA